jgi:hypothetical protein
MGVVGESVGVVWFGREVLLDLSWWLRARDELRGQKFASCKSGRLPWSLSSHPSVLVSLTLQSHLINIKSH